MGEPATPSNPDRLRTRELATAIVESVRNDEEMPHGVPPWAVNEMRPSTRRAIELLAFRLAQEVVQLAKERDRACGIALEWIDLGIPDEDAMAAGDRIYELLGRRCTCIETADDPKCEMHSKERP